MHNPKAQTKRSAATLKKVDTDTWDLIGDTTPLFFMVTITCDVA